MYFAVKEESNGGTTYTVKIGNTDVATGVTLANGTSYHFKVTYDGISAVTAYIGETKYTGNAAIASVGKLRGLHSCVARYNGAITFDNIIVTKEVEAGAVEVPTASITAVDGINRTVTFACATEGVTFSYSTDGENFTTANSVVISKNTTLYVKATKGTKSATSEGLAFEAGTPITLNTPKWNKTGYDASTGISTVEFSSDQSSVLLSPATTIYYSIDGGAATAYSDAISVADGKILTYYASAAGYTNSAEGSVIAVAPNNNPVLWTEAYAASADKQTITRDGDAVTTVDDTDYYCMKAATDGRISDRFLTSSADGLAMWLYRTGGVYGGSTQGYAINGLETGDYVIIEFAKGDGNPVANADDATFDAWNSTATSYKYNITGNTGVLRFTIARYGYIKSITVQRDYEAPDQPIGYVTDIEQTMRKISFACLTDGATIYYNETTDDLESNGWIKYENEFLTNSEYVYAYAQIGTLKSTVLKFKADAGHSIPLNSPTITRTGTNTYTIKATSTTYAGITAYPSDQTINWTINGGEVQTQNGPDAYLENVDGDIVYWTTDNNSKFGESGKVTEPYFVPTVTITDAGWATFYTDLALDFSGLSDKFKTYTATYDGSTVTLSEVRDVPGGTGVVLKGKAGEYEVPVIAAASNTKQGDLMGSTTKDLVYDENADLDYYMLAWNDQTKKAQFMLLNSGTIAKGKAYLAVSKATQSDGQNRALAVVFEGESVATGIQSVGELKAGNDAIYSLSGQRVSQPARGLFIVNGKKVIK